MLSVEQQLEHLISVLFKILSPDLRVSRSFHMKQTMNVYYVGRWQQESVRQ